MASTTDSNVLIRQPAIASDRVLGMRKAFYSVLEVVALLLVLGFILVPILWLGITSLKPQEKAYSTTLVFTPTLDNFRIIFAEGSVLVNEGTRLERGEVGRNMGPNVLNSVIVSGATVLIAIPLATMAAYVFSRYNFMGSSWLLVWILTTQFIPAIVVAIPFFTLFRTNQIFPWAVSDSLAKLVIVNMSIVLPYAIWMIKGFVDSLPQEVEQAAMVDGCDEWQVLYKISLPLVLPGVLVATVFSFIMSWNEFLFALIVGQDNARTLQVALMTTSGARGIMWEQMAAAGLIVMVPIFILSLTIRNNFVNGMTMGAVK